MAKKSVVICDGCGSEISGVSGGVVRVTWNDVKRDAQTADLCDPCASVIPGAPTKRRGRRPKAMAAAAA